MSSKGSKGSGEVSDRGGGLGWREDLSLMKGADRFYIEALQEIIRRFVSWQLRVRFDQAVWVDIAMIAVYRLHA
jgi:hypothetical protein